MSGPNSYIPNEPTTGMIADKEINANLAVQHYLSKLTPEEQARFLEFAHHLVFVGFEEGRIRTELPLDDTRRAAVLVHETDLFLQGAAYNYKNQRGNNA